MMCSSERNCRKSSTCSVICLFIVLLLFWATGSIVDTALWGHPSYNSEGWMIKYMHIIWLALNQFLLPLGIILCITTSWVFVGTFFSAACVGGIVWDLIYSKTTRGQWISDSMEYWFKVDTFVIGFSESVAPWFHILRLLIGGVLFGFILYKLHKAQEEGSVMRNNQQAL